MDSTEPMEPLLTKPLHLSCATSGVAPEGQDDTDTRQNGYRFTLPFYLSPILKKKRFLFVFLFMFVDACLTIKNVSTYTVIILVVPLISFSAKNVLKMFDIIIHLFL